MMDAKRKILLYIEPWIEDGRPGWKQNYIWWFGKLINALEQAVPNSTDVFYIIGDDLAPFWPKHINCKAQHAVIYQRELKTIFNSTQSALLAWLRGTNTLLQMAAMQKLVENKLNGFVPNVIFTITPAPFLRALFPRSVLLHRDAMYCREPWPDELSSFDPIGIYGTSALSRCADELQKLPNTLAARDFVAEIDQLFLEPIRRNNPFEGIAAVARQNFKNLLLLPLQSSGHYNFYSYTDFQSQFDYLTYVLDHVPQDIGIIVTQHPDEVKLTTDTLDYLRTTYPNFIYQDGFTNYHSPSQYLLPLVDGLICVSSGLCYQALLWAKPIFIVGESHFSIFGERGGLDGISLVLAKPRIRHDGLINWLLTRYQFCYRYLYDGQWLNSYLDHVTKHYQYNLEPSLSLFKAHEEPQVILSRLKAGRRKLQLLKPDILLFPSESPAQPTTRRIWLN